MSFTVFCSITEHVSCVHCEQEGEHSLTNPVQHCPISFSELHSIVGGPVTKLLVAFQKIKTSTITGRTPFFTQNSQDTGGFFIFFLLSSFLSFEKCKLCYVYWTVCIYICMDVYMYVWMDGPVFLVASADTNKSFSVIQSSLSWTAVRLKPTLFNGIGTAGKQS